MFLHEVADEQGITFETFKVDFLRDIEKDEEFYMEYGDQPGDESSKGEESEVSEDESSKGEESGEKSGVESSKGEKSGEKSGVESSNIEESGEKSGVEESKVNFEEDRVQKWFNHIREAKQSPRFDDSQLLR